jgi:hypothetical protein
VGAHHDNYAINPRSVGGMVEKSRKTRVCDAKLGKYHQFLGERLSGPKRGTPIIKDLRSTQPPPSDNSLLEIKVELGEIAWMAASASGR